MKRAVFLDRDGVINSIIYNRHEGIKDSPLNPDQFEVLPGVGEAVRLINQMEFLAILASNQPGVAKGKFTHEILDAMTAKMEVALAKSDAKLDGIYYCLHHPNALLDEYRVVCECRKPKPGLLIKGAVDFGVDLERSYMVGDRIVDVQAGQDAGCKTLWIGKLDSQMSRLLEQECLTPDFIVSDLLEGVRLIQRKELEDGNIPGHS